MPRAYIPLKTVPAYPPLKLQFSNGVHLVSRDEFAPANLGGWERIFSLQELREISEWHLAIAYEWNSETDLAGKTSPEIRSGNARLALQVAAPIGTFLSVCIRERTDDENLTLTIRHRVRVF
jgi:hypothetical protein